MAPDCSAASGCGAELVFLSVDERMKRAQSPFNDTIRVRGMSKVIDAVVGGECPENELVSGRELNTAASVR